MGIFFGARSISGISWKISGINWVSVQEMNGVNIRGTNVPPDEKPGFNLAGLSNFAG
jgi:hypothetical protein